MATLRPAAGLLLLAVAACCVRGADCASTTTGASARAVERQTRVLVVRHGESFKNLPHAPSARPQDLDRLTPTGVGQADALAARVRGLDVAVVVASPTGRTRETASYLARATGLPAPLVSDAFASAREGRTPDGSVSTMAWRTGRWRAGEDPRPAGGESLQDVTARAVREVASLAAEHAGRVVVVVTHADVAAALIGQAAGTPVPRRVLDHEIPAGGMAEIVVEGGRWSLPRARAAAAGAAGGI